MVVEGQFATEADMEEWGFTEHFGNQWKHNVMVVHGFLHPLMRNEILNKLNFSGNQGNG